MNDPIVLEIIFRSLICMITIIVLLPILITFIFFPKPTKAIHFDVYLVLGAAPTKDGKLSRMMKSRMDEAISQYQFCRRPLIITGGTPYSTTSEARIMADYAIQQGIASSDILLEDQANSTFENFRYAKYIMHQHEWNRCCIITNAFHVRRAAFFARKFDFTFMCIPVSLRGYFGFPYQLALYVFESFLRIKCMAYEVMYAIKK